MSKAVWWAAAAVALVFTVWVGTAPMADVSLSCSKTGELFLDGGRSPFQCDDSKITVLGVWPLVALGLLLTSPPVVAALAMRRWISWLVVATLVGLSIAGLANWSSYWGSLIFAVPLAALGSVAAALPRSAPHRGTPRRSSPAAE